MKYLLLVGVAMLFTGCTTQATTEVEPTSMPKPPMERLFGSDRYYDHTVDKFRDGDVTCYLYRAPERGGISCLRDATSSARMEDNATQ